MRPTPRPSAPAPAANVAPLGAAPRQAGPAIRPATAKRFYDLIGRETPLDVLGGFTAPRASTDERMAAGKALRETVSRKSHGIYRADAPRADPLSVLAAENATRIAHLVPVRMGRMAASPFAFMRGSAGIMAADLAGTPSTGLDVMACGDMHLLNFGLFGSAERNLVFAINDFDEVYPGPWEWDLKRLATSAAITARFLGGDDNAAEAAARAVAETYVAQIRRYARMGYLEVWYDLIDEASILAAAPERFHNRATATIAKSRARGHIHTLDRLTETIAGQHRIIEDVPLIVRETQGSDGTPISDAIDALLRSYVLSLPADRRRLLSRYRLVDFARKVVGVGSVGTSCWVLLLLGQDQDDPLFLQVKEARPSVLAGNLNRRKLAGHQGQRVVLGQRMIQGSPDIFLGWGSDSSRTRQFYVRQLADMKGGISFDRADRDERDHLVAYSRLCGWALALAHAKSGDPAMIAGYCGKSDALPDAIGKFARAYLDQNARDHAALVAAIRSGRIVATEDTR